MSLNIFKLVMIFLSILLSFFIFQTTEAQDFYIYNFCSSENITTANNTYQENVMSLFSSLSSNATVNDFYNYTVHGGDTSTTVYGLFMCRGDVPFQICEQCVQDATQKLSSECYLSASGIIWYEQCMVRYSNTSFFSRVDTLPAVYMWNVNNVSNPRSFNSLVADTLNQTAADAAQNVGKRYYATKEANLSDFQKLYCLAQCTEDLSPPSCRECLADAVSQIPSCCENKKGGRVLLPSCNIRYETNPFYDNNDGLLSHNCSIDKINDDDGGAFQNKISTLLSNLSSNTSVNVNGFSMITAIDGTVFGLYMCRPDISPPSCGNCVSNAKNLIASKCPLSSEAIAWYDYCLLRYSNNSFFNKWSNSPRYDALSATSAAKHELQLSVVLDKVLKEITDRDERYWMESSTLDDNNETVYILAQCTRDLSSNNCNECLNDIVRSAWSSLGSVGGRVLYPSCTLREKKSVINDYFDCCPNCYLGDTLIFCLLFAVEKGKKEL